MTMQSGLLDIRLITSPGYVWIAEALNTTRDLTVLWYSHRKIMIACITYTIATYYYVHYLTEESKIRKLKTGN